jgi:hypothetical protein
MRLPSDLDVLRLRDFRLVFGAALVSLIGDGVVWETTLQQHIPASARSRVSSYDWFGSIALAPLGYALIGPLAAGVGVSAALYLCGGLGIVALGTLLAVRDIRTLPSHPPQPEASPSGGVM